MRNSLYLILALCFCLAGCTNEKSSEESPYDIKGIITEIDFKESCILVEEKSNDLIWVHIEETGALEKYKEDQEVLVWTAGRVAESAPPITKAVKVKIVEVNN